jgi:moderate conductance mechanosensitive channel
VVATRTPLLAPQDEQTTFVVEQLDRRVESLTDLLTPHLSPAGGFIVERLLTTGLAVVFILLLATLAAQLSRRAIARMAMRMKDPDAPRGRRLRARIGIDAATRVEDARRAQRADALSALATSVVTVIIWTVAAIMVLGQFAIHLGPLIAGAGIVGVTLRSTRIRDVHGTLWHVPNGEIRRVGNMSQEWARALLDVPIAYGADIDVAGELLRRVAVEMAHEADYRELFLDDPAMWGVEQLAADAVVLRLVIKVVPGQQWSIMRELRRRIKNAFDVAGVEVPFAQRTVWLRTEEPASNDGTGRGSYGLPVPDEATVQRAVSASRQGDTGEAVRGDLDAMLPDEPDAMLPEEPAEDPLSS